ncbi:MAG: N-acetyltransferase [Sphingobacteriales bacterium]|nr:MAG: N-acetyltransferase [Sphingobacteriales bacterium]
MHIHLETPRFIIRDLQREDVEDIFEMDSDPEVHRYLGNKPNKDLQDAHNYLDLVLKQYADNGVGRWAVVDKETNEMLGWVGFRLMTEPVNGHVNYYDFGYRLKRSAWNKGVASEAGLATLLYGINQRGFKPIHAMTDVENGASRHVLEKLGFKYVRDFIYDGPMPGWRTDDLRATWYELPETIG